MSFSKSQEQDLQIQMRTLIERFPASGQTVPEFCKANELSVSRYHYWRRKFGLCFRKRKDSIEHTSGFLRVDIKERRYSAGIGYAGALHYELQLPGGRLLRIPFEFDIASLRRLLEILHV